MPEERLQKILSRAGIASRRKAEQIIQEGRVTVNGAAITELGLSLIHISKSACIRWGVWIMPARGCCC